VMQAAHPVPSACRSVEVLHRTAPNPSPVVTTGQLQQRQRQQVPQLTIDVPVEVVPSATAVPSYRGSSSVQDVKVEVRRRPRQTAPVQQIPAVPIGSVSSMAWGSSITTQPTTPGAARAAMQVRSGSPVISGWTATPQRLAHPLPAYEQQHVQATTRPRHTQPLSPTAGRSLSFTPAPKVVPQVAPPTPWTAGPPQYLPQGPCLHQQGLPPQRPWPQPPPLGTLGGFVSPPVAPPSPSPAVVHGLACPSPLSIPGLSSPMPWSIH